MVYPVLYFMYTVWYSRIRRLKRGGGVPNVTVTVLAHLIIGEGGVGLYE